jgi:hypothetical protein
MCASTCARPSTVRTHSGFVTCRWSRAMLTGRSRSCAVTRSSRGRSLDKLRQLLREELDVLEALEADGWEQVRYPDTEKGVQYLVDTRRPTRASSPRASFPCR